MLLLDLDGTLADSEPLHCQAWLDLLSSEYGIDYDAHWFEQWIGTSDKVVAEYVVREHDLDVTEKQLRKAKQEAFHRAVRRAGSLFPGVAEALGRAVESGIPLAIATNSGRADADLMIEATGLDRFTKISVTASDVENMKPAPDIYRLAAERLGVDPHNCVAIEDSGPGGEAAKAAGCYLIGLTDKVAVADEYAESNEAAIDRAVEIVVKRK